jgi:hypothetical protein
MTGKETRGAIKHLLHQMSHGHRLEQRFDGETLSFYLVPPPRRGMVAHGSRAAGRSLTVPMEVICAARERGDLKLWREGGRYNGLRQTRKLTRREQRRLQGVEMRYALERERRKQEEREHPYFVDLYYRESPAHRWKPYYTEPLPARRSREAWGVKDKLRRAKRTSHLQTVIIGGGRDIRDPAKLETNLKQTAARFGRTGIL